MTDLKIHNTSVARSDPIPQRRQDLPKLEPKKRTIPEVFREMRGSYGQQSVKSDSTKAANLQKLQNESNQKPMEVEIMKSLNKDLKKIIKESSY